MTSNQIHQSLQEQEYYTFRLCCRFWRSQLWYHICSYFLFSVPTCNNPLVSFQWRSALHWMCPTETWSTFLSSLVYQGKYPLKMTCDGIFLLTTYVGIWICCPKKEYILSSRFGSVLEVVCKRTCWPEEVRKAIMGVDKNLPFLVRQSLLITW